MEKAVVIHCSTSQLGFSSSYGERQWWEILWQLSVLNTVTIPDRYPLLNIPNFTSRITGSTVFSKLNLQKGYYQVPVAPEDVQKTAIITPFGM